MVVNDSGRILGLRYWCQKILPAVYDDSLSYYELLCKVTDKLNEVIDKYNEEGSVFQELIDEINSLQAEFEKFKEHGFDDYYKAQVDKWVDENLEYIFRSVIKQVYFGLTLTGYFVAYVPDGWDDIEFDTGVVFGQPEYGRLILSYNVDGEPVQQRLE